MKRVIWYLKPYYFSMGMGLIIKFIGTIAELALPWILSYMIDEVIPLQNINYLIFWGVIMLICCICALSFNIIANRNASKVARDTTERIRNDLFEKIMFLSSKEIDNFTMPSLISRASSDTYNIHNMIGMMQRMGVRAPIIFLGGILITLTLDPILTLTMMAVVPVIFFIIVFIYRKGIPEYRKLQDKLDDLVRIVREDISGIRVIKALSKTPYEKEKFDRFNEEAVNQNRKAGLIMSALNPAVSLMLNVGIVMVILVGAYRVDNGVIMPGKIIAFMTYITLVLNAIIMVSRMFVMYSRASASADRLVAVLDSKSDIKVETMASLDTPFHIEFKEVSFGYSHKGSAVENISFRLKKGETLGIIGGTGAGKSTIVRLLMRFYDVSKGSILINGRNIKTIPFDELYTKFGIAFQNDFIQEGNVIENIRFGRNIADEAVKEAAKHAQASGFIEERKDGYTADVTIKGSNLSGGQKQRLLIARALAGNPEILILDDSSSALDYKTDANLRKELYENYKDTTTIIIAQRISSIMNADIILVIDEGKIIGYGNHRELIENCSLYQLISESQMGGVINE